MGIKILLEKDHVAGIRGYDVYRREGGYRSVEKAMKLSPADSVEEVKKSGLRGRGGAGFTLICITNQVTRNTFRLCNKTPF